MNNCYYVPQDLGGPDPPIGGMSKQTSQSLTVLKSWLFGFSLLIQLVMYCKLYLGLMRMPTEDPPERSDTDASSSSALIGSSGTAIGVGVDEEDLLTTVTFTQRQQQPPMPPPPPAQQQQQWRHDEDDGQSPFIDGGSGQETDTTIVTDAEDVNPTNCCGYSHCDCLPSSCGGGHITPTMTFIEHIYIVLWVCKDYFWSW